MSHLGVIFLETLLDIIKENNYPNKMLIFEDEKAILSKTEYHPWYNSILGGSLPLRETVLPDPDPLSGSGNTVSLGNRNSFIRKLI
jgi:hypothetical protein